MQSERGNTTNVRRLTLIFAMASGLFLVSMSPALPAAKPFSTQQPFSKVGHDDWEPSVAADTAGHVYMATTRYGGPNACRGCPDPAIVLRRSSDGGRTWTKPGFICRCRGVEGQHDPVMATDERGRVFMTWMNDFDVQFARSEDFGRTWSRPGSLDGALNFSDKPWIAVSPSGRDVYVFFNVSDPYAVYSHNAGRTWSEPILTTRSGLYFFSGGATVTPDGTVLSSQAAYPQDEDGPISLFVLRSANGGKTWDTVGIDRSRKQPPCPSWAGCTAAYYGAQMAMASDANGRIYVLYNSNKKREGPHRLYLRYSNDSGATWSLPRQVTRTRKQVDHEFPMIVAAGDGDVRIAWMDDRKRPGRRWNVFYRRSTDGGRTWAQRWRLSDRHGGAPYKSARGFRFPYGDYGQLALDGDGDVFAVWGEGPSYEGPGGSWYTRSR